MKQLVRDYLLDKKLAEEVTVEEAAQEMEAVLREDNPNRRRTGATTKMMGKAVQMATAGVPIIVVANTQRYAESIAYRIAVALDALGADQFTSVKSTSADRYEHFIHGFTGTVFFDNSVQSIDNGRYVPSIREYVNGKVQGERR